MFAWLETSSQRSPPPEKATSSRCHETAMSGTDPTAMEPVRHAPRHLNPCHNIATEVGGVEDHQVAPIACGVVNVAQIVAVRLVGIARPGWYEHGLTRVPTRSRRTEDVFFGRSGDQVVANQAIVCGGHRIACR